MNASRDDLSLPTPAAPGSLTLDPANPLNTAPCTSDGSGGPSGIRVGRYVLGRRLGAGGMGAVFEAEQDAPNRLVALKLMNGSLTSDSARARFQSESEHLARLNHPHIAQVYDAGTHDRGPLSIPFFAMELVPGARPITVYAHERNSPIASRLQLLADVADAVHHAHERGVVHRDLKPSNILIDDVGTLKVIDFGLARLIDADANGDRTITPASQDSLAFGTPPYMGPELFQNSLPSLRTLCDDKHSDVYALGVVLYELLCDRLPFTAPKTRDAAGTVSFARIVTETDAPAPRSCNRAINRDVERIILKCLAKDPARRYESAAALAADLRRALVGTPVEARRASATYRFAGKTRMLARRNPLAFLVALALVGLLACEQVGKRFDNAGLRSSFERSAMTSSRWRHFDPNAALSHVRLITMDPETDWHQLAMLANVRPEEATSPKALRAVDGKLMERLAAAQAKARVVAFDLYYSGTAMQDASFVRGAEALKRNDVGVVVGTRGWDFTSTPDPHREISGTIDKVVATGGLTLWPTATDPWSLQAYWKRGTAAPRVSLAVAAAARALCPPPGDAPTFELGVGAIEVHGDRNASFRIPITGAFRQPMQTDFLQPGDIIASYHLEMPSSRVLDEATISYAQVLRASDEQLCDWFDGRGVVVADFRPGADPIRPYIDGRTLRTSYAMLVGLERLLAAQPVRRYPSFSFAGIFIDGKYAADLVVAFIGCVIGCLAWRARLLCEIVLVVVIVMWSFAAYRTFGMLNSPTTACLIGVVASELCALARRLARPAYS